VGAEEWLWVRDDFLWGMNPGMTLKKRSKRQAVEVSRGAIGEVERNSFVT
jgi:hypothetical protein